MKSIFIEIKGIVVVKGQSQVSQKGSGKVETKKKFLPLELSPRGVFAMDGIVFIVRFEYLLLVVG